MIFVILHFRTFTLVIDTAVQSNDNEISLLFKPYTSNVVNIVSS
jgi:hypothetical protein